MFEKHVWGGRSMNILFFLKPKNEVAFLYEDYTLRQALEKMEYYKYTAVPVINRQGNYIGTLNEGDLLWDIKERNMQDLQEAEEIPLNSVSRRWNNEPINVNCEIEDLFMTAMNQNFVPVIDDNQIFIGIITRRDIIQYCYQLFQKECKGEERQ